MVVPDADFVWPGNPEGIQQNLIDSGLEVFWLRLGGKPRSPFLPLRPARQPLTGETECSARPRPAKGSTARGPTAPTRYIEPRCPAGAPAPWRRLFAGVPAAVGSRRPSLHLLVSGGTRTGSSGGRLPGKRAQLGCYFKRAVPINFSSWDGQLPGQSCPTPQL